MSTTTTPQFTESTIVAAQSLAVNANPAPRGTIDLTGAYGAFLMLRVGFQNLTAWDDALVELTEGFRFRRLRSSVLPPTLATPRP